MITFVCINPYKMYFPGIVIAEEPEWKDCIQGSNAVVNLAGMPISTIWSPELLPSLELLWITLTILTVVHSGCDITLAARLFTSATRHPARLLG
ncbi:hypothetical protein ACSBR1_031008 [Camellia fascicularis]